jgi:hypothetical protein
MDQMMPSRFHALSHDIGMRRHSNRLFEGALKMAWAHTGQFGKPLKRNFFCEVVFEVIQNSF